MTNVVWNFVVGAFAICAATGLAGCGKTEAPKDAVPAKEVTELRPSIAVQADQSTTGDENITADPQAMMAFLNQTYKDPLFTWHDTTGSLITVSTEASNVPGKPALLITPTSAESRHLVGLTVPGAGKATTYNVKMWVKAEPPAGVMVELASGKKYGFEYFDIGKGIVVNSSSNADTKLRDVKIALDKGWTLITFSFAAPDGRVIFNIGATVGGGHTFKGRSKYAITLGGIVIEPAA